MRCDAWIKLSKSTATLTSKNRSGKLEIRSSLLRILATGSLDSRLEDNGDDLKNYPVDNHNIADDKRGSAPIQAAIIVKDWERRDPSVSSCDPKQGNKCSVENHKIVRIFPPEE
mmetsp:Transcript_58432/g.153948  ORF Transcript_58432/g.153948 Transcript_58432/m.153948 type:complete len:114 (-) Transcript_58432:761-1102(-)